MDEHLNIFPNGITYISIHKDGSCVGHIFSKVTTTTSCGLLAGLPPSTKLHVVPVLKGFESIETMKSTLRWVLMDESFVDQLVENVLVHSDFHFGGYGKVTSELVEFIQMCSKQFNLPLDPVYTSKAFFTLFVKKITGEFFEKA
jgi:1-aminocyclopropane-1-carboxylate deaminase